MFKLSTRSYAVVCKEGDNLHVVCCQHCQFLNTSPEPQLLLPARLDLQERLSAAGALPSAALTHDMLPAQRLCAALGGSNKAGKCVLCVCRGHLWILQHIQQPLQGGTNMAALHRRCETVTNSPTQLQ